MPENILDRILQTKRKEVAALRASVDEGELKARAGEAPRARNFFHAITKSPNGLVNLIAEVKKASPSAGVIQPDFDAPAIARAYADAGADAISVLTDVQYFQGSLDHLRAVREAVDLPVLRKDFIIDPIQVYESRAAGADAILLIAGALPGGTLLDLLILATELRMTSLIEVHGAGELMNIRSVVGFGHTAYSVLGINNRDLTTFEVDLNTTIRLAGLVEDPTPIVSESGIKTRQEVSKLARAGVKAILVGETLMCSGDVAGAVADMLGRDCQGPERI